MCTYCIHIIYIYIIFSWIGFDALSRVAVKSCVPGTVRGWRVLILAACVLKSPFLQDSCVLESGRCFFWVLVN